MHWNAPSYNKMTALNKPSLCYNTSANIHWCVDAQQILIVDDRRSLAFTLQGLPAALWQWISQGYNFEHLVDFTVELTSCSSIQATTTIQEILESWQVAGLIEIRETEPPG